MKLTKVRDLEENYQFGDKSISHRAVMFGSLAKGTTHISNFYQEQTACQRSIVFVRWVF